ncbi:hypothetical protein IWQ60_012582 [Tieghemiomyces parasiticus]|uniref:Uncharacterized protein n=1 Tax=Tieghemiomyces parasiticus TaxID=78921 RepID=A0A9W8DHG1_9FUNG|nr:hypothetical protein IWQ60_012582 [Tieghemiomyces parasiticus]
MSPSDAAQYASLLSPPMGLYHNSGLSPTAHQGMSSLSLNHGIGYPFGSVPPSPATTVPPESLATFMHHHSPYGPGSVNGLHQTEFPQRGVDNWDQLPDLIADVDDDDTPNLEELPTLQFTQIPTGKQSKSTGL